MGAAFGWGLVAASSLVLGMLLGLARSWPARLIGLVLAFGAGALVSAVSFELFEEAVSRTQLRRRLRAGTRCDEHAAAALLGR